MSFPVSQTIGALTIGSGGVATLAGTSPNPPAEVVVVSSVSITGTGKLNLVNNDLAIDYSAASPIGGWSGTVYSGITNLLVSGRNGGTWTGNGIVTSMTAASAANPITTLGVAESSLALNISGGQTAVFDGQTIDATTVLVKYTYGGDANLNGSITGDDYFLIDAGYSARRPAGPAATSITTAASTPTTISASITTTTRDRRRSTPRCPWRAHRPRLCTNRPSPPDFRPLAKIRPLLNV